MKFKRTLTGIVIATSLCLPVARADDNPSHDSAGENSAGENKTHYEKEVNPIYPIGAMIGCLAVAFSAAYYAMREGKKNAMREEKKNREKLDNK